ncbi:MAG: TolB family protein [Sandaracinaceae bacterium]
MYCLASMRFGPALYASVMVAACVVPADLYEGLPCPCGAGRVCDEAQNACVPAEDAPHDAGPALDAGPAPDAGPEQDAGPDAGPLPAPPPPLSTRCWTSIEFCDWSADFALVEETGPRAFSVSGAAEPSFSPDGCRVYFEVLNDLMVAERPGPGMPFGAPEPLSGINSANSEDAPSITPDGLELFFATNQDAPTGTFRRVFRAARDDTSSAFAVLGPVDVLNGGWTNTWEPNLAPHGLRLYYAPDDGVQFIRVAERGALGDAFAAPRVVQPAGLEPGYSTNRPSVTHAERLLVGVQQVRELHATRVAFYATRPHWRAPFGAVREVPFERRDAELADIGVSPDGCELIVREDLETRFFRYTER